MALRGYEWSGSADLTVGRLLRSLVLLGLAALLAAGCAQVPLLGSLAPAVGRAETGRASWYALHGSRTANGERFDASAMTAAHPSAPFGSHLRVTNLSNGRSVVVRVNDRGPHVPGRAIDVSRAAAEALGFKGRGTQKVRIEHLDRAVRKSRARAPRVERAEKKTKIRVERAEKKTKISADRADRY